MKQRRKPLVLIGNNVSPAIREKFAGSDRFVNLSASIGDFPDGEPYVEPFFGHEAGFEKNAALLKGADVVVVQSGSPATAAKDMFGLFMMFDTLKEYGARKMIAVVPHAPLLRQDRGEKRRFVSRGAKFLAGAFRRARAKAVVIVTPHSHDAIQAFERKFGENFTAVSTAGLFAGYLRTRFAACLDNLRFGAPDGGDKPGDEGIRRARELARAVVGRKADKQMYTITKHRTGPGVSEITGFTGDVAGKICIELDDMVSGGGTMVNGGKQLKKMGAALVIGAATHGILSGDAPEKILLTTTPGGAFAVDELFVSDTIPGAAKIFDAFHAAHPEARERTGIVSVADIVHDAAVKAAARLRRPAR